MMNCRDFQNEVHEFVEGTLSADARAAAEQHLTGCNTCRRLLQKEQQLARILAAGLRQNSETLKLNPEIRHHVLAAARHNPASIKVSESATCSWGYWFRLAAIPLCLLLVAAFLLATHFSRTRGHEVIPMPHASAATPPANNLQSAVSVQISYHLPTQRFHQEGNLVVDTLIDETVVASGIFKPGGKESVSPKLEIKTPL
jgi:anti-sigma factor RsiW